MEMCSGSQIGTVRCGVQLLAQRRVDRTVKGIISFCCVEFGVGGKLECLGWHRDQTPSLAGTDRRTQGVCICRPSQADALSSIGGDQSQSRLLCSSSGLHITGWKLEFEK
jgi:hypothetical protein